MAAVHPDLRFCGSDDESDELNAFDDPMDEFDEFGDGGPDGHGGRVGSDDEFELALAPLEYVLEKMDTEGEMLGDGEGEDPLSAYAASFEDPSWEYYADDSATPHFDNWPIVLAEQHRVQLEKDLRGQRQSAALAKSLDDLQLAQEKLREVRALHQRQLAGEQLDPVPVLQLFEQLADVLRTSRNILEYVRWNPLQRTFFPAATGAGGVPSLQPVVLYADYLRLSDLLTAHPHPEPTCPPEKVHTGAVDYRHDAFSSTPVLLRIQPIGGTMNRAGLKDWLTSHQVPFVDVRVAYDNKDSLGWAAVKVEEGLLEKVTQLLEGQRLEGAPLQVTRLEDVDSGERNPLKKAKAHAAAPPPAEASGAVHSGSGKSQKEQAAQAHEELLEKLVAQFREKGVDNTPLCFIDFELACTFLGGGLPTEVALIHGTLRAGELAHYHGFIHPGLIPQDFEFTASHVSMNLTRIPYQNFTLFNAQYDQLWQELTNFVPPGALVIAKGKRMEEAALRWLHDRALGPGGDALQWLKERDGPFRGIGICEYEDVLTALNRLHQSVAPEASPAPIPGANVTDHLAEAMAGGETEGPAADGDADGDAGSSSAGAAESGPGRLHRLYQWDYHRCAYHQDQLAGPNGPTWHCALCDVRSYLSALRATVNAQHAVLVEQPVPCEEPWSAE